MRKILPVIGVCVPLVSCGGPAPPPFKPVVDTKVPMQAVVDPNADAIWDAVKSIDTSKGSQEIRPKTEEEWTAVRNAAVTVAEAGNLLMLVPRAKNGDDWMQLAQQMVNTGEEAIRAARQKTPIGCLPSAAISTSPARIVIGSTWTL